MTIYDVLKFWVHNDFCENIYISIMNWIRRRLNYNNISGFLDLRSINPSCTYEVDLTGNSITNVSYNPNLIPSGVSVMYASLQHSLPPFIRIEFKGVTYNHKSCRRSLITLDHFYMSLSKSQMVQQFVIWMIFLLWQFH